MQEVAPSYVPLITAVIVSALGLVATLAGVILTQRAARRMQADQAVLTATLERERREHEAVREAAAHSRAETRARWEQRSEAYVAFLASCDKMRTLSLQTVKVEQVTEIMDAFALAEFRALLFAPENVAYAMLLLDDATRQIAPNARPTKEELEKVREAKARFIQLARGDLGMDGTLPLLTRRSKPAESSTSSKGNQTDSASPISEEKA